MDQETMSNSSHMSYAEQAREARAKARAPFRALYGADLSLDLGHDNLAQAANALGQSLHPMTPSKMLPVRETMNATPMVHGEHTSDEEDGEESIENRRIAMPNLKPMEHIVLLPLIPMIRDIYDNIIIKHKTPINGFLKNDGVHVTFIEQMDTMINELKMLSDHQDLITDISSTQQSESDDIKAKWAMACSSKCLFLQQFLEKTRPADKHVVIFARPGRMLDIIESILRKYNYVYNRPDRPSQSDSNTFGLLKVTLLTTAEVEGGLPHNYIHNRADVVIAFDDTFSGKSEHYSKYLRTSLFESGKLAPLISLVVASSAQHIEFCLPRNINPIERKLWLVDIVTQTRKKVGQLDENYPAPEEAAAAVVHYLHNVGNGSEWPLAANLDINDVDLPINLYTQKSVDPHTQNWDNISWQAPPLQGTMKRTLVRAMHIAKTRD
jgi:hypothetical protein